MKDPDVEREKAKELISSGPVDEALTAWRNLAESTRDSMDYNTLGDLYIKDYNNDLAIKNYHICADIFRREGMFLKALAIYKKILNVRRNDPDALYAFGEMNEDKGIIDDAVKYYFAVCKEYIEQDNKQRVPEVLNKILNIKRSSGETRREVADMFLKADFLKEALNEYKNAENIFIQNNDSEKTAECHNKAMEIKGMLKASKHVTLKRIISLILLIGLLIILYYYFRN